MRRFTSLRRQADFIGLRRRGRRISTPVLTLYCDSAAPPTPTSLVGIAVSKAIGKAVLRNQLRRRLKAIVNDALAERRPMRLLIVARPAAAAATFAALRCSLVSTLER